ncbi:L-amino-acid oxidase-like [Pseudophryne corroboree]|uniref:L-amino-acid oxidase-like n=1 Tax=Pseudophryne corroboree TaxID=495146 RepID=UPI003081E137
MIYGLCKVLQPYELATREVSSDTASLSQVIPLIRLLQKQLEKVKEELRHSNSARNVGLVDEALNSLCQDARVVNLLKSEHYILATVLDPRFKAYMISLFPVDTSLQWCKDLLVKTLSAEAESDTATAPSFSPATGVAMKKLRYPIPKQPTGGDAVQAGPTLDIWSGLKDLPTISDMSTVTAYDAVTIERMMEDYIVFLSLVFLAMICGMRSDMNLLQECFQDREYEEVIDIAKYGLPSTKMLHQKYIVIVGAGMSGLSAAKTLLNAGHRVTVLEASYRVGGRVLTHRDPEGWYADLGPMRLPISQRIVREYIQQFGLKLNPFIVSDEDNFYFFNNIRKTYKDVEKTPNLFGFQLTSEEEGKSVEDLYSGSVEKFLKKVSARYCSQIWQKFDKASEQSFLENELGLSTGAVEMLGHYMDLNSNLYISFIESLIDDIVFNTTRLDEITGGFDQLPLAFARRLGSAIRLNSTVVKVIRRQKSVIVQYRKDESSDLTSIAADYVIITSTAKATRLMEFSPPLSHEKYNALSFIHYASATKIYLKCNERFWEKDGIVGGRSVTDRPSRYIYYPSHNFTNGIGVLLASYTDTDDSMFFTALSDEDCVDVVLEDLAVIHRRPKDELKKLCPKSVVKKWSLDPHSMGAFAYFTPYQYGNMYEALAQPEGRIYFAGEHTSSPHGWIDTAIKSGLKAARDIHRDANKFLHK